MVRRAVIPQLRPGNAEAVEERRDEEEDMEVEEGADVAGSSRRRPVIRTDSSASEGEIATPRKRGRNIDEEEAEEAPGVVEKEKEKEKENEAAEEIPSDEEEDEHADKTDYGPNADLLAIKIPPRPKPIMSSEGDGNRLIIHYLEVENFKSYRGKRIIGPFHHCFTSVIGPNGSGKSNVIDALLFVFAFKANRIRSKKLSALIHKSQGFESISSCSVTVHFHLVKDVPGDPGFEIIPDTEFTVGRRATAANASTYYIDGRRALPADVIAKLEEFGIDLKHNRFLILQGEVEQIAQMKPKAPEDGKEGESGMLEYLEDIIGSNRFQKPILALEQRADELSDQRATRLDRVKKAQTLVDNISKSYEDCVHWLQTENEVARIDNLLHQIKRLQSQRNKAKAKRQRDSAVAELNDKTEELERLKKEKEERRKVLRSLEEAIKKHEDAIEAARNEMEEMETRDQQLKEDKKAEDKKAKRAADKEKKMAAEIEREKNAPARLEKESLYLKAQLKKIEEQRVGLEAEHKEAAAKLGEAIKPLQARQAKAEAALKEKRPGLDKAKMATASAESELAEIRRGQQSAQKAVDEMEDLVKKTQTRLGEAEEAVRQRREILPKLRKDLETGTGDVDRLKPESERLEQERHRLRGKLHEVRSSQKDAQQQSNVLRVLLQAQSEGKLEGVVGRLGSLGGIDAKYDIAISTAAPSLNNIVVRTVKDANKGLDILRAANLRASFIIMEKMGQHRGKMMAAPRACKFPRLFDLISCPEGPDRNELMLCFYYAIRDFVVAPNQKAALDLNKSFGRGQGFDIVTEDGVQVRKDGSMIGGGAPSRGAMGKAAAAAATPGLGQKEMERLERAADDAEKAWERVAAELHAATEQLRKVRSARDEAEETLRQKEAEVDSARRLLQTQQQTLRSKQEKLRKEKPDPAQERRLEENLAAVKGREATVVEDYEAVVAELNDVEKDIGLTTDKLVGATRKALDKLAEQEKEHNEVITKNDAKINSSEREVGKLENKVKALVKEREAAEAKGAEIQKERLSMDDEVIRITERSEKAGEALEEAKKEYDKSKAAIDGEGSGTKDLEIQVDKLKKRVDVMEGAVKKCRDRIKRVEQYLRGIQLHDLVDKLGEEAVAEMMEGGEPAQGNVDFNATMETGEESEDSDSERPGPSSRAKTALTIHQGGGDSLEELLGDGYTYRTTELKEYEESYLGGFLAKAAEDGSNESIGSGSLEQGQEEGEEREQDEAEQRPTNQRHIKLQYQETQARTRLQAIPVTSRNEGVIRDYREKRADLREAEEDLRGVTARRDAHRQRAMQFRHERLSEFKEGFDVIAEKLTEMYQMITQGGNAEFEFVDSSDPFQGILFSVRPPKKSWKAISNLSGGEKTLSSLALVFALHHYRPTPLYVMDEIDAALDFKNVSIVGHYIKERTKNAQFVIISLRNQMFELANRLVGIYKVHDSTGNVTIDPDKISALPPGEIAQNRLQQPLALQN